MTGPGESTPPQIDPTDQAALAMSPDSRFDGPLTPELVADLQGTMDRVAHGAKTGNQAPSDLTALDRLAAGVTSETVYVEDPAASGGSNETVMVPETYYSRTVKGPDGESRTEDIDPKIGKALEDYAASRRPQDTPPKPDPHSDRPPVTHSTPTPPAGSRRAAPDRTTRTSARETGAPADDGYDRVRDMLNRRHPGKGKRSTLSPEEALELDEVAANVIATEITTSSGAKYTEYTLVGKDASGKTTETPLPKDVGARLHGHNEAGKKAAEAANKAAAKAARQNQGAAEGDTPPPEDETSPFDRLGQYYEITEPEPEDPPEPPRVTLADLLDQYRRREIGPRRGESVANRLCVSSGEATRNKNSLDQQTDAMLSDGASGLYAIASGIDHPAAGRHGGRPPHPGVSANTAIGVLQELAAILPEPTTPEETRLQMQEMMLILRNEVPLRTGNEMSDAMVTIARVVELEGRRFLVTVQAGNNEVSMYSNGVRRTLSRQQGARGSYTHSLGRGDASRDVITFDEILSGDRVLMATDGIIGSNDYRQKPLSFDAYNDIYLGADDGSGRRPNQADGASVAGRALRAALEREARDVTAATRARGVPVIDDMAAIGLAFDTWNTSMDRVAGVDEVFSGRLRGDYAQGSRPAAPNAPRRPLAPREKAAIRFANSPLARFALGATLGPPWALLKPLIPIIPNRLDLSWAVNRWAGRETGDEIPVPRWGDLAGERRADRRAARADRAAARAAARALRRTP